MNELAIELDLSGIEQADDGDTTHFGGIYKVDGETFLGYGDDRSDSWKDELIDLIHDAAEEAFDLDLDSMDILDVIEGVGVGTILISQDGEISIEE